MTEQTARSEFSVTDIVTATRCPRQFVLMRDGHRVVPYGPDAFGSAAHVALRAIVAGALEDEKLHALLDRPIPDREAVSGALFRLALGEAHAHAKRVASLVDGVELARFADTINKIVALLTPPLAKAAANASSGRAAVQSVFLAAEEPVELILGGEVRIRGRVDLLCKSLGETWVWDLKTYAGSDLAQLEQVRLYAMAYAARGLRPRPMLVHVVRDRIELAHADPPKEDDEKKLLRLARHMRRWLDGERPLPAPDLGTCRKCPAQTQCWRSWGRTLPDEADDLGEESREMPRSEVHPVSEPLLVASARASTPDVTRTSKAREVGKDAPLWIGSLETREPARLEPMELTRHVAVFGASGSGKTYLAKSIVEEAILAGVPVLAFDVQGDILTLAKPLGDDELDESLHRRRDEYAAKVDVRLLTPMSDAGLRISLNPLRFPSHEMGLEESTVYSEAVAENLLAHVKLPPSWRDHARQYLAERIRGAMEKVSSLAIEDLIAGIAEEDVDDPLLDKPQREKLVKQLRLLTVGSTSLLFRLGKPFDLDALLTPSEPGKTPLNVIWLNGLGDQKNKESFVAMVLADLYGWMLRQKGGAPRVLLYFDEVGPYMPPHGEPPSKKLLKRIFKEGRKYGVCGLFCTQNFTDVDYKVVSQANTVAIGRLNASQEKKKAADSLGSPPNFDVHRTVDQLMGVTSGRFIVKRIEGPPHWLQGRQLLTQHGRTWGEEEIRAHTPESLRRAWG